MKNIFEAIADLKTSILAAIAERKTGAQAEQDLIATRAELATANTAKDSAFTLCDEAKAALVTEQTSHTKTKAALAAVTTERDTLKADAADPKSAANRKAAEIAASQGIPPEKIPAGDGKPQSAIEKVKAMKPGRDRLNALASLYTNVPKS